MLQEEVTSEDIAAIVAKWTGIPVTQNVGRREGKASSPGR
jgi:ATP-dependent Clp protease ATP-binding subunit ClpA